MAPITDSVNSIFSLAAVALSGCSVAALCWLILPRMARLASTVTAAPASPVDMFDMPDRYASMPVLWRVCWPLIKLLGHALRFADGGARHHGRCIMLERAGMPPGIQPVHVRAARALCGGTLIVVTLPFASLLADDSFASPLVLGTGGMAMVTGACVPSLWLRARTRRRKMLIERELPFFLDLLALCVQGGLSIQGAMHESVRHGPKGILREEVAQVLAELRAGQSRIQAFEGLARRSGSRPVRASVGAILQSEALGISLGNQLKELARAQGTARFEHAERQALKAPVKLLLPLMVFIFPCTFIVIGFPIFMSMREALS